MSVLGKIGRGALAVGTFGTSELANAGYNYLSKDGNILGKAKTTPTPNLDPSQFQYAGGPNADTANQLAAIQAQGGLDQQAAQASREGAFYGQANQNYDIANAAQMRGPQQIQGSATDQARQLAALGGTNSAIGNLNGTGQQLSALGTQPMGQSYAALQMQQGLDQGMAQQLSMARSGRSLGSGQASLNQAAFNNAGLAQQTNQAAGIARIQEQNNYDQFQLGALGAAGQQYGQAGALAGQAGTQATGIRSANENLQLQNANLGLQQQQVNNSTTGLYNQLGTQQQQLGMQANQIGQQAQQFGQNQATHTIDQQAAANQAYATGNTAITSQNNAAQDKAAADQVSGNRQLLVDGLKYGATAAASDERMKTNIAPMEGVPQGHDWGAMIGGKVKDAEVALAAKAPHSYADQLRALQTQYAPGLQAPADVLNRVPGAGAGPSPSQSALLSFLHGQQTHAPLQMAQPASYAAQTQAMPMAMPQLSPSMLAPITGPGLVTSDVHSKTRIQQLEGQLKALVGGLGIRGTEYPSAQAPNTAALDQSTGAQPPAIDLRPARGYAYDYKDPRAPGAAPGRHVGPMAHDLEHTAAAGAVLDTPSGKQVDTSRLSLVNTAAISEQQRKQQELEQQLAALQSGGYQPAPYDPSLYGAPRSPY